jgi:hypothetical protein
LRGFVTTCLTLSGGNGANLKKAGGDRFDSRRLQVSCLSSVSLAGRGSGKSYPMEWLNIKNSTLDKREFAAAENTERGTWLMLFRYCAGQENGGRIKNCRLWNERDWLALRVTKAEISRKTPLWTWENDDLVLWEYPKEKEREVKRKRHGGRLTALKRWGSNRSHKRIAQLLAQQQAELLPQHHAELMRNGKEEEGNGSTEGDKKRGESRGSGPNGADVAASRTQFAALRSQIKTFEDRRSELTTEERMEFRKKKRELEKLTKKQAAGDFSAVNQP